MFSFISENKGKNANAVTTAYMQIVRDACAKVSDNIETVFKGDAPKDKRSFVVSDTVQVAMQYFAKGYRNQIVWMQGIVPEESYMRNHSRLRFFVLSLMERIVLRRSKLVLLVSEEMRLHYEKKYRLDLSKKSVIMPCFNEMAVSTDVFDKEKYNNNTFVYVGSLYKWQCFEETVKFYADIEKASNCSTKLYVYTFQQDAAKEIIAKYNVKNCEVDCVDANELSERIKGVKYGFVLREDNPVNNVATPTKLSNYISNGIIPVYSSAIRSFAEYDAKALIGIVCDLDDVETGVNNVLSHMKLNISAEEMQEKCEAAFADYYCREQYVEKISEKLQTII